MKKYDSLSLKRKRIVAIISFCVILILMGFAAYILLSKFLLNDTSAQSFEAFIDRYGWWGRAVAVIIQFLQVFIAVIPGEFIEVGLGLSFGAVEGTLLCLLGLSLGSLTIFLLVKKWGVRFAELFVDIEKINSLRFINNEKKLKRLIFILFLIPGTPKDLLTYGVPFTRIKMSEFMIISMIARIPSIISSTIGGNLFGDGEYLSGIILLLITGAISLAGLKIYDIIYKKYTARKSKKGESV